MSPPTGTDLHTSSSASTDSHLPASSIAKDREGYDPWSRMRGSGQEERPWHMPQELGLRLLCTAGMIALVGLALYPAPQPNTLSSPRCSKHRTSRLDTPIALAGLWPL